MIKSLKNHQSQIKKPIQVIIQIYKKIIIQKIIFHHHLFNLYQLGLRLHLLQWCLHLSQKFMKMLVIDSFNIKLGTIPVNFIADRPIQKLNTKKKTPSPLFIKPVSSNIHRIIKL